MLLEKTPKTIEQLCKFLSNSNLDYTVTWLGLGHLQGTVQMWVRSLRWNLTDNRGNGPRPLDNWAFFPTSSPLPLLMRFPTLGTGSGLAAGDGSSCKSWQSYVMQVVKFNGVVESSDQTDQQTEVLQYRARLAIFYGLDHYQKSDNLQYNTLVRWFTGSLGQMSRRGVSSVPFPF